MNWLMKATLPMATRMKMADREVRMRGDGSHRGGIHRNRQAGSVDAVESAPSRLWKAVADLLSIDAIDCCGSCMLDILMYALPDWPVLLLFGSNYHEAP